MSLPPIESLTMYKLGYKTLDEIDEKVRGKFAKYNNIGWAKIDETRRKLMVYRAIYEHLLKDRLYTNGYLTWDEVDSKLKKKLVDYKNKWSSYTKESRKKLVGRAIYECQENDRLDLDARMHIISGKKYLSITRRYSDVGVSNVPVQTIDGEIWEIVKSALLVIIVCAIIALVWICNM